MAATAIALEKKREKRKESGPTERGRVSAHTPSMFPTADLTQRGPIINCGDRCILYAAGGTYSRSAYRLASFVCTSHDPTYNTLCFFTFPCSALIFARAEDLHTFCCLTLLSRKTTNYCRHSQSSRCLGNQQPFRHDSNVTREDAQAEGRSQLSLA